MTVLYTEDWRFSVIPGFCDYHIGTALGQNHGMGSNVRAYHVCLISQFERGALHNSWWMLTSCVHIDNQNARRINQSCVPPSNRRYPVSNYKIKRYVRLPDRHQINRLVAYRLSGYMCFRLAPQTESCIFLDNFQFNILCWLVDLSPIVPHMITPSARFWPS